MHWFADSPQTGSTSPAYQAWQALAIILSCVVLATNQFVKNALPGEIIVVPTTTVVDLVFFFHVLPVLLLFAIDRGLASLLPGSVRWFRLAIISTVLILVARQMQLYGPVDIGLDANGLATRLTIIPLVFLAALFASRFYTFFTQLFYYLAIPSAFLAGLLLFHDSSANTAYEGYKVSEATTSASTSPPVIVVVFDMLAYEALLSKDGSVDRERFPNFARLSEEGMALENATSNLFATGIAVPYLVDWLVSLPDYKVSLYEQTPWIESIYAEKCGSEFVCKGQRYFSLQEGREIKGGVAYRAVSAVFPFDLGLRSSSDRGGVHQFSEGLIDSFIEDIRSDFARGRIFFLHSHLPHDPFVFDEDGDFTREGLRSFSRDSSSGASEDDFSELWDRYLEQIAYTDLLLGRLLQQLEQEGLYNDALLVVTSDHGLRQAYPDDSHAIAVDSLLTRIPVFVHGPGIRPGLSDVDYQHVDFGPTLYDILNIGPLPSIPLRTTVPLPGGSSILAENRPVRAKEFVVTTNNHYWRYQQDAVTGTWQLIEDLQGAVIIDPEEGDSAP
jgi:hypothetical protein